MNDKPKVVGAANRREDVSDLIAGSVFEDFRKNSSGRYVVIDSLKKLIENTKAKYIVLSYSSTGRATFEAITEILRELNLPCSVIEMDYRKNVMATMAWTNEWLTSGHEDIKNKEYLFFIQKSKSASSVYELNITKRSVSEKFNSGQGQLAFT